jgi:hypothetical protein
MLAGDGNSIPFNTQFFHDDDNDDDDGFDGDLAGTADLGNKTYLRECRTRQDESDRSLSTILNVRVCGRPQVEGEYMEGP